MAVSQQPNDLGVVPDLSFDLDMLWHPLTDCCIRSEDHLLVIVIYTIMALHFEVFTALTLMFVSLSWKPVLGHLDSDKTSPELFFFFFLSFFKSYVVIIV